MTNLTIAVVTFLLETNWGTTHVITPMAGYHDSTTYYLQTARVERVEYQTITSRGVEKRWEASREFVLETNLPPRLWPTNAPPSMLGNVLILQRRRGDTVPVPIPPNPTPFRNATP